jgi:hypothetical protein
VRQERCPAGLGSAHVPDGNVGGIEIEVFPHSHHGQHTIRLQERVQPVGVLRGNLLDVETQPFSARDVAFDHGDVFRSARDLEAARAGPGEPLSGVFGEALELRARELHEPSHQIGRPRVADEPRGARRRLCCELVPVDDHHVPRAALDEVECGGRPEPSRTGDDHVGAVDHHEPLERPLRLTAG